MYYELISKITISIILIIGVITMMIGFYFLIRKLVS
jgi:hypothetical protein